MINVPQTKKTWDPDWRSLIDGLGSILGHDEYWMQRLVTVIDESVSLHLAVFVEPYLGYLLDGRKTVESRFSLRRSPPYGRVDHGDLVLLKRTGGPILGLCEIAETWNYQLDSPSWSVIRAEFTEALCAQDPAFWQARQSASFATLMRVAAVRALPPIHLPKRDRRGWVVLNPRSLS